MSTLSFDIFSGEPLFESDFDLTGDVAKGEEEFCFCSATNWEIKKNLEPRIRKGQFKKFEFTTFCSAIGLI